MIGSLNQPGNDVPAGLPTCGIRVNIMHFVMNPDMVYQYPIWAVGLLLVGAAIFGAVLIELCARRLLPIELRQRHNDVAAAIFSIIGVTYAVLLAFVAMLALEGFNRRRRPAMPRPHGSGTSTICQPVLRIPKSRRSGTRSSGMRDVLRMSNGRHKRKDAWSIRTLSTSTN